MMSQKENDSMWARPEAPTDWVNSPPARPGVYETRRDEVPTDGRPVFQKWDGQCWSVRCRSIAGALDCEGVPWMQSPDSWRHVGMALGDDGAPDFTIGRQHFEPKPGHGPAAAADPASALDTQVGGDHYKNMGEFQPWSVLKAWLTPEEFRGYMKGTAIAYLARERDKGGDQDVAKAAHTLQGLIEMLGGAA